MILDANWHLSLWMQIFSTVKDCLFFSLYSFHYLNCNVLCLHSLPSRPTQFSSHCCYFLWGTFKLNFNFLISHIDDVNKQTPPMEKWWLSWTNFNYYNGNNTCIRSPWTTLFSSYCCYSLQGTIRNRFQFAIQIESQIVSQIELQIVSQIDNKSQC